jgi:hypothetical protein
MINSTQSTPNASNKKSKKPTVPMTSLLGGHSISTAFYDSIQRQIQNRLHEVKDGKLYVAKELCGEEFWSTFLISDWQRRMAGRCFAHMVATGIFPFTFKQYKRSPTKRYRLK